MKKIIIAIDGTAGSGKSSLAKALAKKLNYKYIDTGAMYRFLTYHVIKRGIKNKKDIIDLAKHLKISMRNLQTDKIRIPEVSNMVSKIAAIKGVRVCMVNHQRELAKKGGAIVEGRDIGTVVFPDADIKFFMTAGVDERSKRRYKELMQKGIKVQKDAVEENLVSRDAKDSSRKVSPMKPAKDAIVIDTTRLTIPQKNNLALKYIKQYVL
jgi:cytidylate kinase